jgi:hypothetical protein
LIATRRDASVPPIQLFPGSSFAIVVPVQEPLGISSLFGAEILEHNTAGEAPVAWRDTGHGALLYRFSFLV